MEPKTPAPHTERRISRRDLEAVIRRAAELYAADADADEEISEGELLRIASELGLPARHVRQALYEVPGGEPPSLVDRWFGPAVLSVSRALPVEPAPTLASLEEYLTTREYLQLRRRKEGRIWLAPADDTISKFARAFSRPATRYHLARAGGVGLAVQPLEPGWSHLRFQLDMAPQRRKAMTGAGILSGTSGVALGTIAGVVAGVAAGDAFGDAASVAAGVAAFAGTAAATISTGFAIAAVRFRRRLGAARQEVEHLLDRIQHGEPLEPPPAPWRRRLQARVARLGPGR